MTYASPFLHPPASSPFFFAIRQTPLLNIPFSSGNYTTHHCKTLSVKPFPARLSNLTRNPSESISLETIDKLITSFRVQKFVDKISALPISARIEYLSILEKERNGEIGTLSDFNDLLMALVIVDEPDLALKLFSNLSSSEILPDSCTFSIIIRCYCVKEEPIEAKRVLDHMLSSGFRPDVVVFTILINSFCKRGRLRKALEVLEIMGQVECEPSVHTYNCLLKGLCYVGRVEEAFELLMDMKRSFRKPDIYSYTAVMDGFCKVGRLDEAMELLNEALERGLTANVVTFNSFFDGYCREGRPLEGIGLLKQMRERNCWPDYISYSTLLHGLLKWNEIRAALLVYEEMIGAGHQVDERMINNLLRGLCIESRREEGLLNDAYRVFDKMINRVSLINFETYDVVIQTLCTRKEVDRVLVVLHNMVKAGYSPRMITFKCVFSVLCAEGMVDDAVWVLVLMHKGYKIPNRFSYDLLIHEFNRRGRSRGACSVYGMALKLGVIPHRKPRVPRFPIQLS